MSSSISLSGVPSNESNNVYFSNKEPSSEMTPLYRELIDIVNSKRKGISLDNIVMLNKVTKHYSRVRLALDALDKKGEIIFNQSNNFAYRNPNRIARVQ